MKSLFTFLLFIIGLVSVGQSPVQISQVNRDYESYKKESSYSKEEKKEQTIKVKGKLHLTNLSATSDTIISISNPDGKSNYLNAIVFDALQSPNSFQFVADQYDGINDGAKLAMKEMLKINIISILDSTEFALHKSTPTGSGEIIKKYTVDKRKKLPSPIEIIYYSSFKETENGLEKIKKVIIQQSDQIIYESSKLANSTNICSAMSPSNWGNIYFNYELDSSRIGLKGGLWNYLLFKQLEDLSNQIYENSLFVKQVNDIHSSNLKDLKRSISTGITQSNDIDLQKYLKPKFNPEQRFENGINEEQIVTWYSKYYKKSVENLKNQKLNGQQLKWNKAGYLIYSAQYDDGMQMGDFIENYNDLTPKSRGTFKNNLRHGSYLSFYPNGKLKEELNYINGKLDGKQKHYANNGEITFKGKFILGKPKGFHYKYNSEGKRIEKVWYWRSKSIRF